MGKTFYYYELQNSEFDQYSKSSQALQLLKDATINFHKDYRNSADFSQFFQMMPHLEILRLDFEVTRSNIYYIEYLGQGLTQLNKLQELHISFTYVDWDNIIQFALRQTQNISNLKSLNVYIGKASNKSVDVIDSLCKNIKSQNNLESLFLSFLFPYNIDSSDESECESESENESDSESESDNDNDIIIHNNNNQEKNSINSKYIKNQKQQQAKISNRKKQDSYFSRLFLVLEQKQKLISLNLHISLKDKEEDIINLAKLIQKLVNLRELELNLQQKKPGQIKNIKQLANSLQQLKSLTSFEFTLDKTIFVNDNDFKEISKSLQKLVQLNILQFKITKDDITSNLMIYFGSCIKKLLNLHKMQLKFKMCDPSSQIDIIFGSNLQNLNINHLNLSISSNQLNQTQINFKESSHLQKLKILILKIKDFDDYVSQQLSQAMRCMISLEYLELTFKQNTIKSSSANILGEGLKYLNNLIILNFNISADKKFLKYRKLDSNQIKSDKEIITVDKQELAGVINSLKYLSNLKKLYLCVSKDAFEPTDYKIFGNQIQNLEKLEKIDILIEQNENYSKNIKEFLLGFKHLKNLKTLHINISFNGFQIASEELQQLEYVQTLNVQINQLNQHISDKQNQKIFLSNLQRISKINSLTVISVNLFEYQESLYKQYVKLMKRNGKRIIQIN